MDFLKTILKQSIITYLNMNFHYWLCLTHNIQYHMYCNQFLNNHWYICMNHHHHSTCCYKHYHLIWLNPRHCICILKKLLCICLVFIGFCGNCLIAKGEHFKFYFWNIQFCRIRNSPIIWNFCGFRVTSRGQNSEWSQKNLFTKNLK